jgi:hypothetical protein
MMYVGNTTEESNRAIKRAKKVDGVIEYTEKQFQKHFSFMLLLHQLFYENRSFSDSAGI